MEPSSIEELIDSHRAEKFSGVDVSMAKKAKFVIKMLLFQAFKTEKTAK
mgnify:CR=1